MAQIGWLTASVPLPTLPQALTRMLTVWPVRSYLAARGVDAARINARGAGPDEPLAREKTRDARQKNRRTEFDIVK